VNPGHGLVDVQPAAVLTLGSDDHVHMDQLGLRAPVAPLSKRPKSSRGLCLGVSGIASELCGTVSLLNARPGILDLTFNLELVQPLFWSENSVQHQALPFDGGEIAWSEESHK